MGLSNFFRKRSQHKRAAQAADEIWNRLIRGVTMEVPASLSTDDLTTQAVLVLRQQHPDVVVTMLQSKGMVLTVKGNSKVGANFKGSDQAWNWLEANGHMPSTELSPEQLLGAHEAFIRRADLDPGVAVDEAQRESQQHNAVVVDTPESST